ncbi:MAG: oxygen-independent coproporphyrinogen III oxidase [Candidatus Heimdallarchaeota archaeon]|nr:oxygen-independent coproporphyrinogen III oxidase [Candidatus Heimdallarchaeota archaeon]MDH5645788.1 oxygen-independent coproporphyrinogen III oxidase [Candidatus Heimdallarchaeota archaeon]
MSEVSITSEEIEKYDIRVPRYTSYPTVPNWDADNYTPEDHLSQVQKFKPNQSLSLYLHIPFCIRRCLFCACNVLITKKQERVDNYLDYLSREIIATAQQMEHQGDVIQLHLGGGTPTHLKPEELQTILTTISDNFHISKDAEMSIEVHPSVTSSNHLDVLRDFNFNRLSMGVQDFDQTVQTNLNRFQTFEETKELIDYARSINFESINVDLIYGLAYQTMNGFIDTMDKIFELKPERVALYSFAHFPTIFPHHKHIPLDVIPQKSEKFDIFLKGRELFLEHNYQQVGFDHFSLKDDELWKSYKDKSLRRNFMGYTTKAGTDLIAFGYSAISEFQSSYAQNSKDMNEYEQLVDKYGSATVKGHRMSTEDRYRKELIMDILCLGEINMNKYADYSENKDTFTQEIDRVMDEFQKLEFAYKENHTWELTQKGRIFARIVASKFDGYLQGSTHLFSKSL